MKCKHCCKLMTSYLEGALCWRDQLAMRGHLHQCVPCTQYHKETVALVDGLAGLGDCVEPPHGLWSTLEETLYREELSHAKHYARRKLLFPVAMACSGLCAALGVLFIWWQIPQKAGEEARAVIPPLYSYSAILQSTLEELSSPRILPHRSQDANSWKQLLAEDLVVVGEQTEDRLSRWSFWKQSQSEDWRSVLRSSP